MIELPNEILILIMSRVEFAYMICMRLTCKLLRELTYDEVTQRHFLPKCNRKMASVLFAANVRLSDGNSLVTNFGGFESAIKRLLSREKRYYNRAGREKGAYFGALYFDVCSGCFVQPLLKTPHV